MPEDKKINLLLVDDNRNNLTALSAILSTPNYEIFTATSGREALEHLTQQEEFAVILLDVMMPEMDGFEVAKAIKKNPNRQYTPIIFVTAVAQNLADIYQGYSTGAVDYIQKPLDPIIVRAKVRVFADLYLKDNEIQRQAEIIRQSEKAQSLEREKTARLLAEAAEKRERAAKLRAEGAEQRFHDLINWVDHAVLWEFDAVNYRFSFVSQRALEILGYPAESWTKNVDFFFDQIPSEDRGTVRNLFRDAVQGKDSRCEHRFIKANGDFAWLHSGVNPRKDENGNVVLLWGMSVDVTPLKKSENEAKEARERLNLALISARIGAWDLDLTTGKVSRSENYNALYGYSPNLPEWTREFGMSRIHPDDRERMASERDRFINAGKECQSEYRVVWPDESIHWLASIGKVHIKENRPVRLSGITMDITARKEAEELRSQFLELSRMDLEKLKQEREIRETFVATLTHDLRNPLSAAKTGTQLLLRHQNSPEFQKRVIATVPRIIASIERADKMIQDLLDANRIRAGQKLPIQIVSCEIRSVITDAIGELSQVHGDRFVLRADQEIPGYWCCQGVRRAIENLATNAVKYGSSDTPVTITLSQSDQRVRIAVHNEGKALSQKEKETIFEPFRRLKSSDQGRQEGWGLGLTLVRGIIGAHGGSIQVESEPGQGTTFTIELPMDARSYQDEKAS